MFDSAATLSLASSPQTPSTEDDQDLYARAVALVSEHQKASTSWLQRQLAIGYNSAACLIERMEKEGVVSAPNHVGARQVVGREPAPFSPPSHDPVIAEAIMEAHSATQQEVQGTPADQLRLLIERIERIEEEEQNIKDDKKDVYSEAKATGYDVKTIRTIVRLRKMEKNARQEAEGLLETYKSALGIE